MTKPKEVANGDILGRTLNFGYSLVHAATFHLIPGVALSFLHISLPLEPP